MQTDRRPDKNFEHQPTTFSVQQAIDAFNSAKVALRVRMTETQALAESIERLGASLQIFAQDRSAAEMQSVVSAARNLADVMAGLAVTR